MARQLHDTEVEVTVLQGRSEAADHVQLLISEKVVGAKRQARPELAEMQHALSQGTVI